MKGSKRNTQRDWCRGRGRYSLRGEIKYSIKKNKKYLNRKVRHWFNLQNGNAYRKLAKNMAWKYIT